MTSGTFASPTRSRPVSRTPGWCRDSHRAQTNPLVWITAGPLKKGESLVLVFRATTNAQMASGRYYNRVSGYAEKAVAPYDPVVGPRYRRHRARLRPGYPPPWNWPKAWSPRKSGPGDRHLHGHHLQRHRLTPDPAPDGHSPRLRHLGGDGSRSGPRDHLPIVVWDSISVGVNQTVTLRFRATVDRLGPQRDAL